MLDLGACEHPACARPAARPVRLADMVRAVRCCDEHAGDFRECARDGCGRLAQAVVHIGANDVAAKAPELWLCGTCLGRFQSSTTVELHGRRFIHDRSGWLVPLARGIRRG